MMSSLSQRPGANSPAPRKSNLRTALIMASIAAVFFFGIVVRHWLFGN